MKPVYSVFCAVAFSWLILAGCSSGNGSSSGGDDQAGTPPINSPANPPVVQPLDAKMMMDLSGQAGFFDQGFPSAIKQKPNGKIDFNNFPRQKHISTVDWRAVAETTDGYSPMSPVYLRFDSNLAVSPSGLNLPDNAEAYLADDAAVQLINIDPQSVEYGRRHPLNVGYYPDADKYRPGNLLAVQPLGRLMQENTQYALIVTRAIHSQAENTEIDPMLSALLDAVSPQVLDQTISPITASKALQGYQPLRQWLADQQQVSKQQILAATVWRTGQPTAYLQNLVDAMADWPVQLNEPWQLLESNDQYCAISSSWQAPLLIKGLSGYLLPVMGGQIELDEQGVPVVQHYRKSEIVLTIPKTEMPLAGYPLMMYSHGTDGRADQIMMRGYTNEQGITTREGNLSHLAAIKGWAASGMAGHMGAEHQDLLSFWDPILDGIDKFTFNHFTYNPVNPMAMRNNLVQMVAERMLFRRLINQQQIDASICGGVQTPNGLVQFDPQAQVAAGHSLGTFISSAMAALDSVPYKGIISSGAGTYSLDLSLNLVINGRYTGDLFENAYWQLPARSLRQDPLHPFWILAEAGLAPANTGLQINRWHYQKEQNRPHSLVFQGYFDSWVSVTSQKLLHRALAADLVGAELDLSTEKQLLPQILLAGGQQLTFPAKGNYAGKTNLVVRYAKEVNYDGHRVLFQYDQAKHQLSCFLEDISLGLIPEVIQGSHWDNSCR